MGGLRGLGRLGKVRQVGQVGVRAAPAIVGRVRRVGQVRQVGRVGGRAERAFVRCLLFVNCLLIVRLSFAHRSVRGYVIWKYKIWCLSFVIYNYFVLLCADTFLSFFEYAKTFDFSN